MNDIFGGKADIALSTNKLFETGFYLLNLGCGLPGNGYYTQY